MKKLTNNVRELRHYAALGVSALVVAACGAGPAEDTTAEPHESVNLGATASLQSFGFTARAEPWVIHRDLDLGAFQRLISVADNAGYGATSVSAYDDNGTPRYSVVLEHNPARDGHAYADLTAAELQTELDNARNSDFRPIAVDAYSTSAGVRYTLVTTDNRADNQDWFLHIGLTGAEYQTDFEIAASAGYRPEHVTGYEDGGSSRYTAIWVDSQEGWVSAHGLSASQHQHAVRDNGAAGLSLVQVDGHTVNGQDRYSSIWLSKPDVLIAAQHNLGWSHFSKIEDDQRRSGLRPVSVDVFGSGSNPRFAAAWRDDVYSASVLEDIDNAAQAVMATHGVRGLSLAIAENGQLKLARGFGRARSSWFSSVPATSNTKFRWASVSKPITSALVLKLAQEGQLNLSDLVFGTGTGLLSSRFPAPYAYDVSQITVQDLLEHTSGGWGNSSTDPMGDQRELGQDEFIEWVLDAPEHALAAPPTSWDYSNFGYILLGRIVEEVTGQTYEEAAQQRLFIPAGADFAIGGNSTSAALEDEAHYYNTLVSSPYAADLRRGDSAGGWVGTPADLLKLMVRLDGRSSPSDLINLSTFQSMTAVSSTCVASGKCSYAQGWGIGSPTGATTGFDWKHNGGLNGTRALLWNRADGISGAIVINDTSDGEPYLENNEMEMLVNDILITTGPLPDVDLF